MKKIISFILFFLTIFSFWFINQSNAWIFDNNDTEINYCHKDIYWNETCWLEQWVGEIQNSWIQWLVTIWKWSEYVQKIVAYWLSFLAIVAVLLIIYAGFNLLISIWDEEKAKKSKTIIIFALLGLLIIFLAKPITTFVIDVLSSTPTP